MTTQKQKCERTKKLEMWHNIKTEISQNWKTSNLIKLTFKMWQNSKTHKVKKKKLKNSKCENAKKRSKMGQNSKPKMWQNSKTKYETQLKKFKCDQTQTQENTNLKYDKTQKFKMWQNPKTQSVTKLKKLKMWQN